MKKISNLLMMALLTIGMGLTSCDEQLDNAVIPYTPGVTPETDEQGEVAASSIALDQTLKVIKKGGAAFTITATVTPSDATFTWESSDEAVATVADGVVTPVGNGIATITAKSGDVTATCEVFVGNEVDLGTKTDDYPVQNYDILKGTLNSSYAISIPNDIKVVFNGVQTTKQIACDGNSTIILADGSENSVTASSYKAGIQIGGTGTTLTINGETAGDGKLTVQGGINAAGIGTSKNETGGNIVINGGTVTATGGFYAAGIGTGFAQGSTNTNTCGTITINGGTVIVTGGMGAAGIGAGFTEGSTNTCRDITINGGTVTATGGYYAAGIGTGYAYGSPNTCGAITIGTGVTSVTATKGNYSPNIIGKGFAEDGGNQTCGTITFGTAAVFNGSAWSPATMVAGNYGGLKLVISKTNVDDDTWTLTPAE